MNIRKKSKHGKGRGNGYWITLGIVRICALSILFAACTGVEPAIDETRWRIVYHDDSDSRFEEIHINLRLSDGDGYKDLAQIIVSNNSEGLEWKVDSSQWITEPTEIGKWTTLPPILPAEGGSFSSEVLTLTLEDLGGESAQTTFRPSPSRPRLDELEWPIAKMEDGILELVNNPGPVSIILRNAEGTSIQVMPAFNGMRVDTEQASTWEIWVPLPDISSAFLLGPYSAFLGR